MTMTPLAHAHPTDLGLCPERTQRLMDVLRREVASGRLPGAVAMIARRGQIGLFEAVGQQAASIKNNLYKSIGYKQFTAVWKQMWKHSIENPTLVLAMLRKRESIK